MRIAVLIGGTGRSLKNLVDHGFDIPLVVGHRPGLPGFQYAPRGAATHSVNENIFEVCGAYGVDLICMAGWIKRLAIPEDFAHRVMNIHPSLLPAFGGQGMYGHHVHEAVIASGVKVSGCTVHFADNDYDTGPIILQRAVEVPATAEELAARVFEQEKIAYPEAIRLYEKGRLVINGGVVKVTS